MDRLRDAAYAASTFISSTSLASQLTLTLLIILVASALLGMAESAVVAAREFGKQGVVLLRDTYMTPQVIPQEQDGEAPLLYPSSNERDGVEFSYSAFLFVKKETFDGAAPDTADNRLRHVFHKGGSAAFPLMGPGVFVLKRTNTLRVFMNSIARWDEHVDVPNIPVDKWFHLALVLRDRKLDVYVNGNVAARLSLTSVPKINYSDVHVLRNIVTPPNVQRDSFAVDGAAQGMVSRLHYYAFALNFAQIDALYREGPSTRVVDSNAFASVPPYMADSWWTKGAVSV